MRGFRSDSKSGGYGTPPYILWLCRGGFHTRRLGLMSSHNAAESLWWPLEGLGIASISHEAIQPVKSNDNVTES